MSNPIFSENFISAARTTANAIAGDALEVCESNEEFMEMIVDADRLATFAGASGVAASEEFILLLKTNGYHKLLVAMGNQGLDYV